MTPAAAHRAIEALWRIEAAKIIGGLARLLRDVGLAEDLAQDALLAALETWPSSGIPEDPGAWLMTAAQHRALNHFRRNRLLDRKHEEPGREMELEQQIAALDAQSVLDDDVGDDLLRLTFTACHPVLSTDARVAFDAALARRLDD